MRIQFWGTRGSLPVATEGALIRDKIKRALLKADGRRFDSEAALVVQYHDPDKRLRKRLSRRF